MRLVLIAALLALPSSALASQSGLIVNAVEYGVAKFHRYDNKVHAYAANSTWKNFILPDNATTLRQVVQRNADGSYTIFFSAAEEMLQSAIEIAHAERRPIQILNLEAHGMPGGMWYPIDAAARSSQACSDWVTAAQGDDRANYEQYYTPATKDEVLGFRKYAQVASHAAQPCTSGLTEWTTIIRRNPAIISAFGTDGEIHFISCIVGLGLTGQNFTTGFAQILFGTAQGRITTSVNFGLGDWSMPEGMGFWDYENDQQLARDAILYPRDRDDREIMQKGSIRVAGVARGQLGQQVFGGLDFQYVNELTSAGTLPAALFFDAGGPQAKAPEQLNWARIPGTTQLIDLNR
jgi:hypothetical protein